MPKLKLLQPMPSTGQRLNRSTVSYWMHHVLETLWQQRKGGGNLLYFTCSSLKAQNERQRIEFLAQQGDVKEIKIEAEWGVEQIHGRQLLPTADESDGFFYGRIEKTA